MRCCGAFTLLNHSRCHQLLVLLALRLLIIVLPKCNGSRLARSEWREKKSCFISLSLFLFNGNSNRYFNIIELLLHRSGSDIFMTFDTSVTIVAENSGIKRIGVLSLNICCGLNCIRKKCSRYFETQLVCVTIFILFFLIKLQLCCHNCELLLMNLRSNWSVAKGIDNRCANFLLMVHNRNSLKSF